MMTTQLTKDKFEEIRKNHIKKIMENIKCTKETAVHPSGLQVGLPTTIFTISHDDFPEITIRIGHLKSGLANYNLAMLLFELAISEYIK